MLRGLIRAGSAIALTTAVAGRAWADVRPDPTDPSEPLGMLAIGLIVLVAGGFGYFLYRRRRK